MGANLKSSKGVAVGPDAISREPAAWARGATTAALFLSVFSCIFRWVEVEKGEEVPVSFLLSVQSDRTMTTAGQSVEERASTGKQREKVEVEVEKKKGEMASLATLALSVPMQKRKFSKKLTGSGARRRWA